MMGKTQSFLGGRGERHPPLANRGRKPFINSEAERRGGFTDWRQMDLALRPYKLLYSRPVRRRLNTVHSRNPLRRMHAVLLARIWQVLHFKESPAGVRKNRRTWMNMWKCLRGLWRKDGTNSRGLQNCLEIGKKRHEKKKKEWKKNN